MARVTNSDAGYVYPYPRRSGRKHLTIDMTPVEAAVAPTAEQERTFRQEGIDYANFPVDASYISVADVKAAYRQGLRDAAHIGLTALTNISELEAEQQTPPIEGEQ